MASGFLEWVAGTQKEEPGGDVGGGFGISPGVVTDNFNLLGEGLVQVHIPSVPDFDPWARVAAIGGGSGRGFLWIPQIDDEVLVAFNSNDARDAYIIGGLWSMLNRPPALLPTDFMTKRVIKTGLKDSPLNHTIEIDDALQSIKITTSTSQEITLDPKKIAISATAGALKISLDIASAPPAIQVVSAGDITLKALGTITLDGSIVKIGSKLSMDVSSNGAVSIKGLKINLN